MKIDYYFVGHNFFITFVYTNNNFMFKSNTITMRFVALLFTAVLSICFAMADNNKIEIGSFGYKVQPPTGNLAETAIGTIQTSASVSSMGASTCDISIDAPKGPTGVKPQIGLSYNSLRGVGVAGYGFDIYSISVITCGMRDIYHDGKNNGISFTDDDAFFLDGKRLIKSNETNDKMTFNPEGNMDITVYMEHDAKVPSMPVFIIQDSEGNTITYGSSTSTRDDYTSTSGKYCNTAWYVDKCVDRCGNITQYYYIKDKLKKITTKSVNDIFRQYYCEYSSGVPMKRLSKVTSSEPCRLFFSQTMEYDSRNRVVKMSDSRSNELLLTQTDAISVTIENIYDDLNRLVKTDIDGISTTYEYGKSGNSFGLPMKEQVNDMKEERKYNEYGDVIKKTRNINGMLWLSSVHKFDEGN